MLTFNQLLRAGGLDPANVRLARHTPERQFHRPAFDAAMRGDPAFQQYQEVQGDPRILKQFRATKCVAGFVVDPTTKDTMFMGVWDLLGEQPVVVSAFVPAPRARAVAFKTRLCDRFDGYRGRLIVEWGKGERTWVQRADKQDKTIVEIRKERQDPAFPGFMTFRHRLDQIETLPLSWSEVLRNARGVYLLVHRESGNRYVGSACGDGGFLNRWLSYANGHGGNVAMVDLGAPAAAYDVAILEVVGTDATEAEILRRETLWKDKLGTRRAGLNRN